MSEEIRPSAPGSAAHEADTSDAHDASAVSVTPAGGISSTDVQAALVELDGDIAAGGVPSTIVDAKGDLIVATAADTVARRAVGADGTVLTADAAEATGVKWATPGVFPSGTSFPAQPAFGNDIPFYRTDRDLLYFYDGTRWLTVTLYDTPIGISDVTLPVSSTTTVARIQVPHAGVYDLWLEDFQAAFFVNGGTALGASHKWVVTLIKEPGASAIATINIDSGASSTYRNSGQIAIDALVGTTTFFLNVLATKTGTPGPLYLLPSITDRMVG